MIRTKPPHDEAIPRIGGLFLAARAVAGALQGLFIAAAFATGVAVVPAERIGRAIA